MRSVPRRAAEREDRGAGGTKVEFIRRLEAAGLQAIETTSFVPAKWVPQMGDAEEVLAGLEAAGGDATGRASRPRAQRAGPGPGEELGLQAIAIFGSATETFAQQNLNRSVTEQYAMFEPVVKRALADGMWVRAYVSMCFGDRGRPRPDRPGRRGRPAPHGPRLRLPASATRSASARPATSIPCWRPWAARNRHRPDRRALPRHHGQALANTMAALRDGVSVVDASTGGLGGCPYAKSATGNLATEDLVWAPHRGRCRDRRRPREARRDQRLDGPAARAPEPVQRRPRPRRLTR